MKTLKKTLLPSFICFLAAMLIIVSAPSFGSHLEEDPIWIGNENGNIIASSNVSEQVKILKTINNVEGRTQTESSSRDTLYNHNGTYYYIYSWHQGSRVYVSMIASTDSGSTWSSKVDLWNSTYYTYAPFKQVLVWKGDLYAFFSGWRSSYSNNQVYMKKASLSDWTKIGSSSLVTIRSSQAHNFGIVCNEDYIFMAMVRSSQWQPYFYRYDGTSWTSGIAVDTSSTGANIDIEMIKVGPVTKIMVFYSRQGGAGDTYMRYSTDNGTTWSTRTTIMDTSLDYGNKRCDNINGTLILISGSTNNNDDLDICISTDNGTTWTDEKRVLSNRGLSDYHVSNACFTLGTRANGRVLMLAYEGDPEEIRMIYSKDWGSNWLSESDEITIHSTTAFDPVISNDGKLLSCTVVNGSNFDSVIIDISELFFDDFAPQNLSITESYLHLNLSWDPPSDDIFNNYTFENYTIYRGVSPYQMYFYEQIGNRTWFNDTIITTSPETYYYAVTSVFSEIGESAWSDMVSGEPLIPPPVDTFWAVPGDFFVNLSWLPPPVAITDQFDVSHYTLYRGGYHDSMHPLFTIPIGTNWYNDTTVDRYPGTYLYKLTYTLLGYGEMKPSETLSGTPNTLPGLPTGIDFQEMDSGMIIGWQPPYSNGGYDIESYTIYRGDSKDDMIPIGNVDPSSNTFTDNNLIQDETFFYSVSATNRLGEGRQTEPLKIDFRSIPSSPRELTAIEGDGEIELKWSSPAMDWDLEITEYTLYRSVEDGDKSLHFVFGGDVHSFTDPVTNGVTYSYWLSASNKFGEGYEAGPVSAVASGKPGPVGDISVSLGNEIVSLSWEDVEDDGGTPLLGYRIYRSFQSDVITPLMDIGPGLFEYTDIDLINGNTYYYRISALNLNGEGPVSDPISAVPGRDPFSVSQISGYANLFSSRVSWSHPDNGGDTISSYRVYRGTSVHSLSFLTEIDSDPSESPTFVDHDLAYGPVYFYGVSAVNDWGESDLSPIIPVKPYGLPSSPEVYHVDRDLDSFRPYWYSPDDDGGKPVIGYHVSYKERSDPDWTMLETMSHSTLVEYLTPGTVYDLKVCAFTDFGDGSYSDVMSIKIGAVPDYVEDITSDVSDGEATLAWSEPGDGGFDLLGYRIYLEDERGIPVLYSEIDTSSLSFTATDLENGNEYSFWVSAFNDIGEGPLSDRISAVPVGVPGAVLELWVTEANMGTVTLRWNSPLDTGGLPIDGFSVYRGESEFDLEKISEVSVDDNRYEDTDLDDGTTYYYRISAFNEIGEGPGGSLLDITPVGVPSKVEDLKIEATTDTVDIEWLPPDDDHGSDVIGYYIYKGTSPVNLEMWKRTDSGTLSVSDEDVESGTYYYRVVPFNSVGSGDASDVDVEVPSRTGTAVIIGVGAFLIPLIIIFLALILPALIKRNKKRREEREAREARERKEIPPPQPQIPPGPQPMQRPGLGAPSQPIRSELPSGQYPSVQAPTRQLPPMQAAPAPPTESEAYIRPERRVPAPRDKDSYLRQNGMRPSEQVGMQEPPDHNVPDVPAPAPQSDPVISDQAPKSETNTGDKEAGLQDQ